MPDTYENLKIPPAMEAVIEVSIAEVNDLNFDSLVVQDSAFCLRFAPREELKRFESTFDASGVNAPTHSNRTIGYIYKSLDGKEIIQFRSTGFSYSRLGDYPGWSEFFTEFQAHLKRYIKMIPNALVQRIGVRFINVINIKGFHQNYSDYFHVYLQSSETLNDVSQYHYSYIKEFPESGLGAVVNFSPDTQSNETGAKFILDIDVIKPDVNQPLAGINLNADLEQMRNCKNKIFFGTLKDSLLEEFR